MTAGRGAAEAVGMPEELADTSGRSTGTGRPTSLGTAAARFGAMPMSSGVAALGPRVSTGLETAIMGCGIAAAECGATSVPCGVAACSGMAVGCSDVVLVCGLAGAVAEDPSMLSSLKSYVVRLLNAHGKERRRAPRKTGSDGDLILIACDRHATCSTYILRWRLCVRGCLQKIECS